MNERRRPHQVKTSPSTTMLQSCGADFWGKLEQDDERALAISVVKSSEVALVALQKVSEMLLLMSDQTQYRPAIPSLCSQRGCMRKER